MRTSIVSQVGGSGRTSRSEHPRMIQPRVTAAVRRRERAPLPAVSTQRTPQEKAQGGNNFKIGVGQDAGRPRAADLTHHRSAAARTRGTENHRPTDAQSSVGRPHFSSIEMEEWSIDGPCVADAQPIRTRARTPSEEVEKEEVAGRFCSPSAPASRARWALSVTQDASAARRSRESTASDEITPRRSNEAEKWKPGFQARRCEISTRAPPPDAVVGEGPEPPPLGGFRTSAPRGGRPPARDGRARRPSQRAGFQRERSGEPIQ